MYKVTDKSISCHNPVSKLRSLESGVVLFPVLLLKDEAVRE